MLVLVVIVRVEDPELPEMEEGLKAQTAPVGKPLHDSVDVELNPKFATALTVDVAEFPANTGDGVGALAESSNPGGVVLRSTPRPPTLNDKTYAESHGKTMSVWPSPFISAYKAGNGSCPFLGTCVNVPNVPSPLPNWIPVA